MYELSQLSGDNSREDDDHVARLCEFFCISSQGRAPSASSSYQEAGIQRENPGRCSCERMVMDNEALDFRNERGDRGSATSLPTGRFKASSSISPTRLQE